jgi:hypothetical protein
VFSIVARFTVLADWGGCPGDGLIFKVLMHMRVALVRFFHPDGGGFPMCGAEVRLPGGFRTHST